MIRTGRPSLRVVEASVSAVRCCACRYTVRTASRHAVEKTFVLCHVGHVCVTSHFNVKTCAFTPRQDCPSRVTVETSHVVK